MSYKSIHAGLEGQLATISGLPVIAAENIGFTPTLGTPFVRPTFMPIRSVAETIGINGYDRLQGLYQVDVFYPTGNGASAAEDTAQSIMELFSRGSVINKDGVTISIDRAWRDTANSEPNWFRVPVVVAWKAYL